MTQAKPIVSLLVSIASQVFGFGIGMVVEPIGVPPIVGHSISSFFFVRTLRLSTVWQIFNLTLPIVVSLSALYQPPPLLFPLAGIMGLLIYLPTFWTRVPFYPTSIQMYRAVANELPSQVPFRFLDLGSGFGSLLFYLARVKPNGQFFGVEISPLPLLIARIRSLRYHNVSFSMKSLWKESFADYDLVYAFLSPEPMSDLAVKCSKEMKRDGALMVNTFRLEKSADKEILVPGPRQTKLYIYTFSKARN